jgi:hypothetical protein
VALQPVLYGWLSKLNRVWVLASAWVLIGLGVASTGLADKPWQYMLTVVVWTAGEVVHGVVGGAIVADLAPVEARGRYQGAFAWVWAVARLAAPATASGLFATVGQGALWWGCAAVGVGTAAVTLGLRGAIDRRTAAAEGVEEGDPDATVLLALLRPAGGGAHRLRRTHRGLHRQPVRRNGVLLGRAVSGRRR